MIYKCRLLLSLNYANIIFDNEGKLASREMVYQNLHRDIELPFIPPTDFRITGVTEATGDDGFNVRQTSWNHSLGVFLVYLGSIGLLLQDMHKVQYRFSTWVWEPLN